VPHSHMKRLHAETSPKNRLRKWHAVTNGTHNDTWMQGGQAYWDAIRQFVQAVLGSNGGGGVGGSCDKDAGVSDFGNVLDSPGAPYRRSTSSAGTNNKGSGSNSAIPIMPSNLMGIARESIREEGTASADAGVEVTPIKKEI